MFQSPSHRGGGAAKWIELHPGPDQPKCFNPLLIGEAAPPGSILDAKSFSLGTFQSPSHRGGGAAGSISP